MDANERLHRASEEAADWWALLQGQDLTREQREDFVEWLRDSQRNVAEMLRLAQVHDALEHFQQWAEVSTDGPGGEADVIELSPQNKPDRFPGDADGKGPRSGGILRWLAFAVPVAAAVAFAAFFILSPGRGELIATERGERREVVLEDGSVVQVDPETQLRVRFEESIRRVALTQGRAVFHVAKNASRPFIVQADNTTVRAVGTAFGVERRERDVVVVTVAEGKVAVSAEGSALAQAMTPDPGTQTSGAALYLTANQQLTVHREQPVAPVRNVSSERELAWAEGRLVFRNDPVSKVVAEFNRYNRVQIRVSDPALAARPISGVFDATNPEAFIAFIQNATSVLIERDETRSIVISPADAPR
jgi:transmembrane sensor